MSETVENILTFAKPICAPALKKKEVLDRLVMMANRACIVAINKTMSAIYAPNSCYSAQACKVGSISDKMVRAMHEVGLALPVSLRAYK